MYSLTGDGISQKLIELSEINSSASEIDGKVIPIDTIVLLRAKTVAPSTVWVSGYHTKGDGAFGSNIFEWDSTSVEDDNGGTIIKLTSIATGRYKLKFSGSVNIKWFGAKGDETYSTQTLSAHGNSWDLEYMTSNQDIASLLIDVCSNFSEVYIPSGNYYSSMGISFSSTHIKNKYGRLIIFGGKSTNIGGIIPIVIFPDLSIHKTNVEIYGINFVGSRKDFWYSDLGLKTTDVVPYDTTTDYFNTYYNDYDFEGAIGFGTTSETTDAQFSSINIHHCIGSDISSLVSTRRHSAEGTHLVDTLMVTNCVGNRIGSHFCSINNAYKVVVSCNTVDKITHMLLDSSKDVVDTVLSDNIVTNGIFLYKCESSHTLEANHSVLVHGNVFETTSINNIVDAENDYYCLKLDGLNQIAVGNTFRAKDFSIYSSSEGIFSLAGNCMFTGNTIEFLEGTTPSSNLFHYRSRWFTGITTVIGDILLSNNKIKWTAAERAFIYIQYGALSASANNKLKLNIKDNILSTDINRIISESPSTGSNNVDYVIEGNVFKNITALADAIIKIDRGTTHAASISSIVFKNNFINSVTSTNKSLIQCIRTNTGEISDVIIDNNFIKEKAPDYICEFVKSSGYDTGANIVITNNRFLDTIYLFPLSYLIYDSVHFIGNTIRAKSSLYLNIDANTGELIFTKNILLSNGTSPSGSISLQTTTGGLDLISGNETRVFSINVLT